VGSEAPTKHKRGCRRWWGAGGRRDASTGPPSLHSVLQQFRTMALEGNHDLPRLEATLRGTCRLFTACLQWFLQGCVITVWFRFFDLGYKLYGWRVGPSQTVPRSSAWTPLLACGPCRGRAWGPRECNRRAQQRAPAGRGRHERTREGSTGGHPLAAGGGFAVEHAPGGASCSLPSLHLASAQVALQYSALTHSCTVKCVPCFCLKAAGASRQPGPPRAVA